MAVRLGYDAPLLAAIAGLHQAPVGLIGAEDVVAEDVGEQLDVAGFEQPRERVLLVAGSSGAEFAAPALKPEREPVFMLLRNRSREAL